MSLARTIIYGTANDVAHAIANGAELNEIDEYGYTPLVQAAIVNDIEKAKIILAHHPDINFPDLTNRTPLHWAADNNSLELARLLLKNGADPNAYTRAGQPVLAMPYLRQQQEMKRLLYQYHASLPFAQDFINTKLLGHRFSLEGRVDIVDSKNTFIEVEFEGFYLEFNLAIVLRSLLDFKNNFGGKHLRQYFDKLALIIDALYAATELIKYQHYLADLKQNEQRINQLIHRELLIIPIAFEGHAISLIKYKNWFIRCDRGEFGRDNGTVIIYRIQNPAAYKTDLVKFLIYKRQYAQTINEELVQHLGLQIAFKLPLSPQISGNCSWSNVEAVIPAILFVLLLEDAKKQTVVDMKGCEREALNFYHEWEEWDKDRALYFCIESFQTATPARKASKAAILAAILFQQLDFKVEQDRIRAEKILKVIVQRDYYYILKSYIDVFSENRHDQRYQNLLNFLDDYGLDLTSLY